MLSLLTYVTLSRQSLRTADIASVSWRDHGEIIIVDDIDEAYRVADDYASEHVQILTETPRDALTKMQHYGALFLGKNTCVSYGDKCIGTNQYVFPSVLTGGHGQLNPSLVYCRHERQPTIQAVFG